MKYSLVNGVKQEASPKMRGACPLCGAETIAKCGNQRIRHWAHGSKQHCDPWWESETDWHRLWKSYFPEVNQEVVQIDRLTDEKHVADVKTDTGMVIEMQNSPISPEELHSRELFYGKMFWVVNGVQFKNSFHILSKLPDPSCEFTKDIVFHEQRVENRGKTYHRKSENPGDPPMVRIRSTEEISEEINRFYIGHHLFDWKNPRQVWFTAQKPVFIDFHESVVWWLQRFDNRGLMSVRKMRKEILIQKNGGKYVSSSFTS
jgi:competence protein CoiA